MEHPVNDLRGMYVGTISEIIEDVGQAYYLAILQTKSGDWRTETFKVFLNKMAWMDSGLSLGARITGECEVVCLTQDVQPIVMTTIKLLTVMSYDSIGPDRVIVSCKGKLVKGPNPSLRRDIEVLTGLVTVLDEYNEKYSVLVTAYRKQCDIFKKFSKGDDLIIRGNLHTYKVKLPLLSAPGSKKVKQPPVIGTEISVAKIERCLS